MKKHNTIRRISVDAIFLAFLVVCAFISIPVSEISFTLQVLGVCLIAFVLPTADGLLILTAYLVMGLIGIPVFAGGAGGFAMLTKVSFGYIIGFIFVPLTSLPFKKLPIKNDFVKYILGGILGLLIIYIFGTAYFYFVMKYVNGVDYGLGKIITICVTPYIPFDIAKIVVAAGAATQLVKVIQVDKNKEKVNENE